ncbi:HAD domain-containing protein [Streptomyces sp. NPDC054961]
MRGTQAAARPFLFLDVDGPLIPFGAAGGHPVHEARGLAGGSELADGGHPLLSRVDPALGPRLAALPCELVWATTWGQDANLSLSPRLGLPELAVVDWPEPGPGAEDGRGGTHWKTAGLVARAAGRAFVWVDDEITSADRLWVGAHHPGPALLYRVDHRVGLAEADFAVLEGWLRDQQAAPSAGPERPGGR